GLFRSEDEGTSWEGVAGFNQNPMRETWTGGERDGTPDGPKMHSILIDPRDPNHMYIGMSSGCVFESRNKGVSWKPLNQGCAADFIPIPDPEYGHDPHCVRLHPAMPDRLYQQNHCGIYRMERPTARWVRVGRAMPKKVGDIGFPITLHPRDPDVAWVFPMDGGSVWPRTSPDGKPSAYVTRGPAVNVYLSSHFRSYTAGKPVVVAAGATLGEVLFDLDRLFPGLRFRLVDEQDRLRRHVRLYVNLDEAESLATPVTPRDEVHV